MYIAGYEVATGDEIVASEPCFICSKLMVNAGISEIITKHDPKMIQENDERRKQGYVVCEVEPFKVETMDAVYEKMAKKVLQA